MSPIVLVIFYSRCGTTEALALASAVGAVQARGLIRLRRLPDSTSSDRRAASPECQEALNRMHKEYVEPKEADIVGANAIVVAAPAGCTTSAPEWGELLSTLTRLQADGRLAGKVAAVVDVGDESTRASFLFALGRLGFTLSSPAADKGPDLKEYAIQVGRAAAEAARTAQEMLASRRQ
jgi:NAD(P)H dehydrogenase (quinone)